jgi:hypothetical protein
MTTRTSLRRIAVHVVARARVEASGRFSLRVTPGGFGTPDFGMNGRRIRVSGSKLVVESDMPGGPTVHSMSMHGASLAELALFAGVDLSGDLNVGHDTPPLGDIDVPIDLDGESTKQVADWYGLVAAVLDRVLAELPSGAEPTLARLWPEHFDVAMEAWADPERRVNLGGSPGDGFCEEPYLYVGPWTADRPGSAEFWNAPFGSFRTASQLADDSAEIVAAGAAFLLDGYRRLGQPGTSPT